MEASADIPNVLTLPYRVGQITGLGGPTWDFILSPETGNSANISVSVPKSSLPAIELPPIGSVVVLTFTGDVPGAV